MLIDCSTVLVMALKKVLLRIQSLVTHIISAISWLYFYPSHFSHNSLISLTSPVQKL